MSDVLGSHEEEQAPVLDPKLRRGGWRMMGRSLRNCKPWIVSGVSASLAWAGLKLWLPLVVRDTIDDGLQPYDAGTVLRFGALILAITAVIAASSSWRRYAAFAIAFRSETNLRLELYAHLQRLHWGYHDEAHTGQLMARGTTDLRQIAMMLIFIPATGANVVMIVGAVLICLSISVKLTLAALFSLPFLEMATVRFSRKTQPQSMLMQQRLAEISGIVEESVTGVRVVKGFGAEDMQLGRMRNLAGRTYEQAMKLARLRANFNPLMEVLPTLGLVGVLFVGGREVIAGRLTVGDLATFNLLVLYLVFPLRILANAIAAMARGAASAARVFEVLSTVPAIAEKDHPVRLPSDGEGEVRFERVSFGYGTSSPILDDLSFTIRPGEAVALVGRTGSGKSTVGRLLPRFYEPSSGTIRVDGVDIRELTTAELRGAIAIVFEETFLFTDTIRDNIAFANPSASDDDVVRAAKLAGAHEFISAFPNGYETMLGEAGLSLSGGQRQRIAIARAILARPRVLILDDATSAVDPTKEHEIRAALEEVTSGTTTIIIGHRPATIALADRVLLLADGRIVAEGSHDELLATSPAYREVLAQAEAVELSLTETEEVPAS
ncbi:MAG TPA: ABC transporter ATP-binding protein [Acidimicrobiales bacterium]|nr:ABC transporter ATP-binding protein [Acidimicrobiales bacterium]